MPEGRENDAELLRCFRVSVWKDDEVLELEGGDGCPTMWRHLMPLSCIHKNG